MGRAGLLTQGFSNNLDNFQRTVLSETSQLKQVTYYFIYIMLLKWHNYQNGEQAGGCRGWGWGRREWVWLYKDDMRNHCGVEMFCLVRVSVILGCQVYCSFVRSYCCGELGKGYTGFLCINFCNCNSSWICNYFKNKMLILGKKKGQIPVFLEGKTLGLQSVKVASHLMFSPN